MKGLKPIWAVVGAEGYRFVSSFLRLFLLIFFFLLAILFLFLYQGNIVKYRSARESTAVMLERYAEEREKNQRYIDMYLGKIPQDVPLSGDPAVQAFMVKETEERNALLTFYLETATCEYDYIKVQDLSMTEGSASEERAGAMSAWNLSIIAGFLLLGMAVILGCTAFHGDFAGKHAKLWFQTAVGRKWIFHGRMLFLHLTILAVFLILAITGVCYMRGGSGGAVLIQTGERIKTTSMLSIFFPRLFFSYLLSVAVLHGTVLLQTALKKHYFAFLAVALVLGVLFGIGFSVRSGDAIRYVPLVGLLFNRTGFFDGVLFFQLPLLVVLAAGGYVPACRRYKKLEV